MTDPRGAAFPFRIDPQTGGVAWHDGADKIRDDLRVLLGTRLGERPMLRDFGTGLHALAQEPADDVTESLLRRQAMEAVLRWERRVVVTRAQLSRDDTELSLVLGYVHSDEPVAAEMIVPLA